MTTTNRTQVDRWLHGGVAEDVIKSASVPVAVVPPDWIRPFGQRKRPRLVVALDGSREAEHGLDFATHVASLLSADLVLLRVVHDTDSPWHGAEAYVRDTANRVQSALPGRTVTPSVTSGSPSDAILQLALEVDADAIVITSRPSGGPGPLLGRTISGTLERSLVPLIVLGPHVSARDGGGIRIGALVRTLDGQRVGDVHRVLLDLEQQALAALVVLGSDELGREVLVPIDLVEEVEEDEVLLRLAASEFAELPQFIRTELTNPTQIWTSFDVQHDRVALVPVTEYERVGRAQRVLAAGTRVVALDDELGVVTSVECDPITAHVSAFHVRSDGLLGHELRVPVDWIQQMDEAGNLRVAGARADIEAYLGHDRRWALP